MNSNFDYNVLNIIGETAFPKVNELKQDKEQQFQGERIFGRDISQNANIPENFQNIKKEKELKQIKVTNQVIENPKENSPISHVKKEIKDVGRYRKNERKEVFGNELNPEEEMKLCNIVSKNIQNVYNDKDDNKENVDSMNIEEPENNSNTINQMTLISAIAGANIDSSKLENKENKNKEIYVKEFQEKECPNMIKKLKNHFDELNGKPRKVSKKKEPLQQQVASVKEIEHIFPVLNKYPQYVDEYLPEIYEELKRTEHLTYVNPDYMKEQKDINYKMRAILIDWLVDVHLKYQLNPNTLFLTVFLIDKYLESNIELNRSRLQLVGIGAMLIASKYEEIYPRAVKEFVYITDGAYENKDLIDIEYEMLRTFNFSITVPTMYNFLEIFCRKLNLKSKVFALAWFIMEENLLNIVTLNFYPSEVAAASVEMALKHYGNFDCYAFTKVTGYTSKNLTKCKEELKHYDFFNKTSKLQAIRRKFNTFFPSVTRVDF